MEDYFDPRIIEALSKQEQYTREAREHNRLRQVALNQKADRASGPDNVTLYCCCQEAMRS